MTISDLQKYLAAVKRKHGDIEVIEQRFSDYRTMDPVPTSTDISVDSLRYNDDSNWALVQGLPQQGGAYIMRDHYTLREKSEAERTGMGFKTYLLYKGN